MDDRIEIYKSHNCVDKVNSSGGGDSAQQKWKKTTKAGVGGASEGTCSYRDFEVYTHKDHEDDSSFSAMFKCTATDIPKNLLKRASLLGNSDEQRMDAHKVDAEAVNESDENKNGKEDSQKSEKENVEMTVVLKRDVKAHLLKLADELRLLQNPCKDFTHQEYEDIHVEIGLSDSQTNCANQSKLRNENLKSIEDEQISSHSVNSDKQSCWRESDSKCQHGKSDWKHAVPDYSPKSLKIQIQAALMDNKLESKEKGAVTSENDSIAQPKHLQEKSTSLSDDSNETAEMTDVRTSLENKRAQSEVSSDEFKSQDVPLLHIYMKEKHQPEIVAKEPKHKSKAKKVKASKKKKLHLFRDGFTLPSATKPVGDANSAQLIAGFGNEVQASNATIKIPISREVAATADDMQSPTKDKMQISAKKKVAEVILGDTTELLSSSKSTPTRVHPIKARATDAKAYDFTRAVDVSQDALTIGPSPSLANNLSTGEGDSTKIPATEGRHRDQTYQGAQNAGYSEEKHVKAMLTPTLPQISSRRCFPLSDVGTDTTSKLATTLNESLLVPNRSVASSLASTISHPMSFSSDEPESNSETVGIIQGILTPVGNTISTAGPTQSSFVETPLTSYRSGKRVRTAAAASSCPRMSTTDTRNSHNSRLVQQPVSQNQAHASNSVPTLPLQLDINPPAWFNADGRANGNFPRVQSGTNSRPGFPFPAVSTTSPFYGQGSSAISGRLATSAADDVSKDSWSNLRANVPESGQVNVPLEPVLPLATAQLFSFPSSIDNGGVKSVWPGVTPTGFARKLPEQTAAPSPMVLWPHLYPRSSSTDNAKASTLHMETGEGNNPQSDMGARLDSESEVLSFSPLPECGVRSTTQRPKLAYNPLAAEQDRQRQLLEALKPPGWSTLSTEHDFHQNIQYGNSQRLQDNQFFSPASLPQRFEQLKLNNMNGAMSFQSSATTPTQFPLQYQMDHALPDSLRNDFGLTRLGSTHTFSARKEEPHLVHPPATASEMVTGAVNLDQSHLCCYCFTRRAEHLVMDCQHLGPCLECAASMKIEYCRQPNCLTKVTKLLRYFL